MRCEHRPTSCTTPRDAIEAAGAAASTPSSAVLRPVHLSDRGRGRATDQDEAKASWYAGRVAAVVAVHRPGAELLTCVTAALAQVCDLVVVVDEHPVHDTTAALLDACRAAGATIVQHGANRGIGAALDTGVARLRDLPDPPTHVLTLDQDSAVPPGYVDALVAAGRRAAQSGVRVGMVAPENVGSMIRLRRHRRADDVVLGGEPIQSGLLVPMAVLIALDGFDESLFIDGVDTDIYLRAMDQGLRCVVAAGMRLEHRLGRPVTAGGRELPLTMAATFRYYYQWRNLVLLLRRHARRHPVWAAGAVLRAARHLVIVTVVAPGRSDRLRTVLSGLWAGVGGRTGISPGRG